MRSFIRVHVCTCTHGLHMIDITAQKRLIQTHADCGNHAECTTEHAKARKPENLPYKRKSWRQNRLLILLAQGPQLFWQVQAHTSVSPSSLHP